MYFKVASVLFLSVFLSGCSMFSDPKPKKPDVKVAQKVENNVTDSSVSASVENIEPMKESVKTVEEKYKLKPEPFSLKSNEADPELLGPQTTIDRSLDATDEPAPSKEKESKKTTKAVDRKVEEAKAKLGKAKEAKLPSADNKKEAL